MPQSLSRPFPLFLLGSIVLAFLAVGLAFFVFPGNFFADALLFAYAISSTAWAARRPHG